MAIAKGPEEVLFLPLVALVQEAPELIPLREVHLNEVRQTHPRIFCAKKVP